MDLTTYLNTPIPRKYALASVVAANASMIGMYFACKRTLKDAEEIINDQAQRIKIFRESTDFLLEHADDSTLRTLNSNLDYWRVVRGMPVEGQP